MDHLLFICERCLNQRVAVATVDGRIHEGVLVRYDNQHVYLNVSPAYIANKATTKAFGFPILALALFDILAISLIAGGFFI